MVKTISLSTNTKTFDDTITGLTRKETVEITNTGTEVVSVSGVTSPTCFGTRIADFKAFKSTHPAFTIDYARDLVNMDGSPGSEEVYNIVEDNNGDFIISGTTSGSVNCFGAVRALSNRGVFIVKYGIVNNVITRQWVVFFENAGGLNNDENGLTIDPENNIYVGMRRGVSRWSTQEVFIGKVSFDGGTASSSSLQVDAQTGFLAGVRYFGGFIFFAYYRQGATPANSYELKRINLDLTVAETITRRPGGNQSPVLSITISDDAILIGGQNYNAAFTVTTWFLDKFTLDGSNNLQLDFAKIDDVEPTDVYAVGWGMDDKAYIMGIDRIVYDRSFLGLWSNDNVDFNTSYAEFRIINSSRLYTPVNGKLNLDGIDDFKIRMKFKQATNTTQGLWSIPSSSTEFQGCIKLLGRLYFYDKKSGLIIESNNVITGTALPYDCIIQRINGTCTVFIDSGAGYVDETASVTNGTANMQFLNNIFQIGYFDDGVGPFYTDANFYNFEMWKGSNNGTFTDDYKLIDFDFSIDTDEIFINRVFGWKTILSATTSISLRTVYIYENSVYVVGHCVGEFQDNFGISGTQDAIICKLSLIDGTIIWKKQFDWNIDYIRSCVYSERRGRLLVTGDTNGTVPNTTNPGNYSSLILEIDPKTGDIYESPAGVINLDIGFTPEQYIPYSGNVTIASDAVSTPDVIAVSGTGIYQELVNPDFIVSGPIRLDYLSYIWFGSFNYVNEILLANPHITKYMRKENFLPANTHLIKPVINITDQQQKNLDILPTWRQ